MADIYYGKCIGKSFRGVFGKVIFVLSAINYSELTYDRPSGTYEFPNWAVGIGWTMAAFSAIFIPIMVPVQIWRYKLTPSTLYLLLKPQGLKDHQRRPQDVGEETLDNFTGSPEQKYAERSYAIPPNGLYTKKEEAAIHNPSFQMEKV